MADQLPLTICVRSAPRYANYDYTISLVDSAGVEHTSRNYKTARGARSAVERFVSKGHSVRGNDWDKIRIE